MNSLLGFLILIAWVGIMAVLIALAVHGRDVWRERRRDRSE